MLSSELNEKKYFINRRGKKVTTGLLRLCQIDPPLSPCPLAMVSLVRNALLQFDRASLAPIATFLPLRLMIACSLLTLPLLADDSAFAFWGDVAFYRRSEGNSHRLIIDKGHGHINPCGGCSFGGCRSDKLVTEFDYQPGFQVGLAYMTRHSIFEAKYLWIEQWESSCHRHDPGLLFFSNKNPDISVDFSGADKAHATYKSQFQNGEMNYFWFVTPRRGDYFSAGWLVGIRYVNLIEHLEIEFENGGDESPYRVHVRNHIPALQVGGTVGWNPMKVLSWDLVAKIGLGFDWYRQHTYFADLNNTQVIRNYEASSFATPFVAEAALSLTYQPWRFINIHAAYGLIYLSAVALAPDQLDKRVNPEHHRIRAISQVIFHGWTAGAMFSF